MSRLLVALAFAVGAGLGLLGGVLPGGNPQDAAWLASSIGLILGCALLAARHANEGRDIAAAGFALVAAGEIVMQAGQGGVEAHRLAAFARGAGLYVPGLLLLAWSDRYPAWPRALGGLAAAAFAAHTAMHFFGLAPQEDGWAASIGYILLSLTMAAWVAALYRHNAANTAMATAARGS